MLEEKNTVKIPNDNISMFDSIQMSNAEARDAVFLFFFFTISNFWYINSSIEDSCFTRIAYVCIRLRIQFILCFVFRIIAIARKKEEGKEKEEEEEDTKYSHSKCKLYIFCLLHKTTRFSAYIGLVKLDFVVASSDRAKCFHFYFWQVSLWALVVSGLQALLWPLIWPI